MNKRRLQLTIDTLRSVEEVNFDLDSWKCGTTACAVGWVGQSPWAINEGFKIVYGAPTYNQLGNSNKPLLHDWEAVNKFYDLGKYTSNKLFLNGSYRFQYDGTEAVIYRLNLLLRVGEKAFNSLSDSQLSRMTKNHIDMMKEVQ